MNDDGRIIAEKIIGQITHNDKEAKSMCVEPDEITRGNLEPHEHSFGVIIATSSPHRMPTQIMDPSLPN